MLTTLCSRVLLNLREASARSYYDDFTKHTGSRMVFAATTISIEMTDFPLTTRSSRDARMYAEP